MVFIRLNMKRTIAATFFMLALTTMSFAQDFEVRYVDHLANSMYAKINKKTDRPDGKGKPCAVLRITTENIRKEDRESFTFDHDLGSKIIDTKNDGRDICLWVTEGITNLEIKSESLGNLSLWFTDFDQKIKKSETYEIHLVGTNDLSKSSTLGSCQVLFRPVPEDAVLYLNEDSIGIPKDPLQLIAGNYEWAFTHKLCRKTTGIKHLPKGTTDTVDIHLCPAHGYIRIEDDYGFKEDEVKVYLDGEDAGYLPFHSNRLESKIHEITLEKDDVPIVSGQIQVKEGFTSIEDVTGLMANYYYRHKSTDSISGTTSESLPIATHTRFEPIIGKVNVNSEPQTTVQIDGKNVGNTPLTLDTLLIGTHSLTLTRRGYDTLSSEFIVYEGKDNYYYYQMHQCCIVNFESDTLGVGVYLNKKLIGVTPFSTDLPFGTYEFTFMRGSRKRCITKEIMLTPDEPIKTIEIKFGQYITFDADKKSRIYLERKYLGKTPNQFYISSNSISSNRSNYLVTAEHGWKSGEIQIEVDDEQPMYYYIETEYQTPTEFLKKGAFFFTGNMAFMNNSVPSYGLTIGDICKSGKVGWFVNLMAIPNNHFEMFNFHQLTDGSDTDDMPWYYGEQSVFRASANIGALLKIAGPVYTKIGLGAGVRNYAWNIPETNEWVTYTPNSWRTMEASLGLQCCIYNFVVNADALVPLDTFTQKKGLVEFRVGFGFCFKHTK